MARSARQVSGTGIYHVMLRGVNRDAIFLEDADFERFLQCLSAAREASGCRLLAWCLMTNHAHLVIRESAEPVGDVVRRLAARYVWWFNHKYDRVGHLFQGRFRSLPVEDDGYLVTLVRYVWANPVEAGLVERPEHYRWSSRRLLGSSSALVDTAELTRLMPPGWLDRRVGEVRPWVAGRRPGRPPRHTDAEASRLLQRACGATGPDAFALLPPGVQYDAVRELRMRSVSYATAAKVTGLSASTIRRLQVGGGPRGEERTAAAG